MAVCNDLVIITVIVADYAIDSVDNRDIMFIAVVVDVIVKEPLIRTLAGIAIMVPERISVVIVFIEFFAVLGVIIVIS